MICKFAVWPGGEEYNKYTYIDISKIYIRLYLKREDLAIHLTSNISNKKYCLLAGSETSVTTEILKTWFIYIPSGSGQYFLRGFSPNLPTAVC